MQMKARASGIFTLIIVLSLAAAVSGCTSGVSPAPTPSPAPPTPAPAATPASNDTYLVQDYSLDDPQYTATLPLELKTHTGNFSLYGKITINGAVPPGYVYRLKPNEYHVSESNKAVDTIGILEVYSVSMSYSRTSEHSSSHGSSMVTLRSFVDPQGNYRIDGLNPGEMIISTFRMYNAPGNPTDSYHVGLIHLNLTKAISRCDLDLTDPEFEYLTSDNVNLYTATGTLKNADL